MGFLRRPLWYGIIVDSSPYVLALGYSFTVVFDFRGGYARAVTLLPQATRITVSGLGGRAVTSPPFLFGVRFPGPGVK